jgi:DNA modification methylase
MDGRNWYSIEVWQRYASPVWMDINQTRTLQYRGGRDEKDEQHISPLQLDVIERCIDLWSNPGDTVLTPFLGIGSEVWGAVEMGRRGGIGIELAAPAARLSDIEPEDYAWLYEQYPGAAFRMLGDPVGAARGE